jgi:GNAT superfamily N-acetyltransferase
MRLRRSTLRFWFPVGRAAHYNLLVHIRAAEPTDFEAIIDIEVRAGALFVDVGMPEIAAHPPGDLEELAAAEALLVATDDEGGAPIGYAWIERLDGATYLEQLSVLPEEGRQGVGTALLEAVVAWARARGDRFVTLTTFRDVPFNGPLYAKRGFVHIPEAEWTDAEREAIDAQAALGMDREARTVMRRAVR